MADPWEMEDGLGKGFVEERPVGRCKGSRICTFGVYPSQEQYGCQNRVQFKRRGLYSCCFICGTSAKEVYCPGVKIWEYGKNHMPLEYYIKVNIRVF